MANLYKDTRQYKKAYEHEARFSDITSENKLKKEKSKLLHLHYSIEREKEVAQKQLLIAQQKNELREKNIWIATVAISALLLAALLALIYRNARHRNRLHAASLHALTQEQEIDKLQAKVEGEEQERSRIARELHDGIGSQLLAVKLSVNDLLEMEVLYPKDFKHLASQLEEASRDLRRTAHNLMPELLLQQGLELSAAALCEKTDRSTHLEVNFQSYGSIPRLPHDMELSLLRMLQELIQNVLKHAEATSMVVQLNCRDHLLSITVEDNGKGFPVDLVQWGNANGMGLQNLRRRVKLLKGHLDIQSEGGNGTTVFVEFDLKQQNIEI